METSAGMTGITQSKCRCGCDVQSVEERTVEARDGHASLQWEGRGEAWRHRREMTVYGCGLN